MAKKKTTRTPRKKTTASKSAGKARSAKTKSDAKSSPGESKKSAPKKKKATASTAKSARPKNKTVGASKSPASKSKPAPARKTTPTAKKAAGKTGAKPPARAAAKPARKAAAPARSQPATRTDNGDMERPVEIRKTKLTPKELEEFKDLLLAKRRELVGDVTNLESEAMRQNSEGGSASSSMPIHMADIGSDTWEQELTLGLIANERGLLREIDEALDRIENRTYGICLGMNKPITKSRLRAKPWAKYCIEYARKLELGLV